MISSWSISRLEVFESCPYRAYLEYVEKIPKPSFAAMDRGRVVHDAAETYVKEGGELVSELLSFKAELETARSIYEVFPEQCIVEDEWAFDQNWQPVDWRADNAWGRLKLDYGRVVEDYALIVDYKTGKQYPTKHLTQGQLYSIVSFLRFANLAKVDVEFWYVDSGEKLKRTYSRLQAMVLKDDFDRRAQTMTSATHFPPRSSRYACDFCPYGEKGNQHCDFRYSTQN